MKKEVMKKWVAALRSGQFKQGFRQLELDGKFCCLGVLCQIAPPELPRYRVGNALGTGTLLYQEAIMEWAGLRTIDGDYNAGTQQLFCNNLASANDHGQTFEEIADIIEKNWKKL
jgi:hypothetical protein